MEWITEQAVKLAQNEAVIKGGLGVAKFGYKYATNEVVRLGVDAGSAALHAVAFDALDKKQQTAGEVAEDAVKWAGVAAGTGMLGTMALQGFARSEYGSSLVGKGVDKIVGNVTDAISRANAAAFDPHIDVDAIFNDAMKPKGPEPLLLNAPASHAPAIVGAEKETLTVGKMIKNSMQKFVKPVNMGKLALGGVGMAAGLIYSMANNKQDGVGGTAMNALAGAGIVMMGHEIYSRIADKKALEAEGKKKFKTPKERILENIGKAKETRIGGLAFESMDEILNSKSGKEIVEAMKDILNTKEGKVVSSAFNSVMNLDFDGMLNHANNLEELSNSWDSVEKQARHYIGSPRGQKNLHSVMKEAVVEAKINMPDFKKAYQADMVDLMNAHMTKVRDGLTTAQKLYTENETAVKKALGLMFDSHEVEQLHNLMNGGISKIVKGLDDLTASGMLDSSNIGPKDITDEVNEGHLIEGPVDKSTAEEAAKKHSEDIAHNTEKKETVNPSDIVKEDLKQAEKDAVKRNLKSQEKITGWMGKAKVLGAIGLGAFAVATVMDASDRLDHKSKTSEMVNQEQKMKNKKQHEVEKKYHAQAYGAINMGDMVTQMFQDRIGHHKMGNAKFAPNQYQIQGQTYNI
jgi:hypothetical protein